MLMTIAYVYVAKYLQIEGEMINNVFTLIFLQQKIIKEEFKKEFDSEQSPSERRASKKKNKQQAKLEFQNIYNHSDSEQEMEKKQPIDLTFMR